MLVHWRVQLGKLSLRKQKWKKSNTERIQFLEKIRSNQYVHGSTIQYDFKKPFADIAEMKRKEMVPRAGLEPARPITRSPGF